MSVDEIRNELQERWRGTEVLELCLAIIDFISSHPADQTRMLTFKTILSAVKREAVDEHVLAAINVLANTRIHVLDTHAMLVDDDDEEHEIDPDRLAAAQKSGELFHPETGDLVPDFEAKIFPYFVPTERITADRT